MRGAGLTLAETSLVTSATLAAAARFARLHRWGWIEEERSMWAEGAIAGTREERGPGPRRTPRGDEGRSSRHADGAIRAVENDGGEGRS